MNATTSKLVVEGNSVQVSGITVTQPERDSIVKEFEWATTELAVVVAELAQRLSPILRPDYDAEKTPDPSDPMPPVSAARSQLHNLHEQTARVRWILNLLEV